MNNHLAWLIAVTLIVGLLVGGTIGGAMKRKPPAAQECAAGGEGEVQFDWLLGGHMTANQIDCMCDALAAIDDAREDAPLGSPMRAALDRLHAEADALVSASVK